DADLHRTRRAGPVRGGRRHRGQGAPHLEGLTVRAPHRFGFATATILRALAPAALALAVHAAPASAQTVTEVRVERVRPPREKHATLRFLKDNRDFIRGRFDLLRAEPRDGRGTAAA